MGSRQGGATLYDHALLADRKTSIGKAWLAATLGRTSGLLKWKRGELESVNIPKTCRTLSDSRRPMPLRLTGHLLYGVVRIYSRQSEQVYIDATQAQNTLRKALSTMAPTGGAGASLTLIPTATDIDMATSATTRGPITFAEDPFWFAGDFDHTFDLEWEAHLDQHAGAAGLSWSSGISSGQVQPLTPLHSPSGGGGGTPSATPPGSQGHRHRFIASQDQITLPAYRHLAGESALELISASAAASPLSNSAQVEIGRRVAASEGGSQGGEYDGMDESVDGGGFDFIVGEDVYRREDFDLGLDDGYQDQGGADALQAPRQARSRDVSVAMSVGGDARAGEGDAGGIFDADDFGHGHEGGEDLLAAQQGHGPETQAVTDALMELANADGAPAKKKKKKKVGFARADPRIDRGESELQEQALSYQANMQQVHDRRQQVLREQDAEKRVKAQGLFAAPRDLLLPGPLVQLWDSIVGTEARKIDEAMKQIKQQIAAGVEIEAVDALAHDAQAADAQHGHALHEQSANDGGVDFLLGAEDGFEIGTTDAMPAVGDMTANSIEVGRRSVMASPNTSATHAMPWDFAAGPASDMSGSIRGDVTPRSRRSLSVASLGGGVGGMPLHAIAHPSPLSRGAANLSDVLRHSTPGGLQAAAAIDVGDAPKDTESQKRTETQLSSHEGHVQADNLLAFAKGVAISIKPQPLFFSDLAPLSDTEPGDTARAFYNLLTLATNGKLTINQPMPYGEIEVNIGDEDERDAETEDEARQADEIQDGEDDQPAAADADAVQVDTAEDARLAEWTQQSPDFSSRESTQADPQ